eukprot:11527742-Alexandrium_andersonii.AAC.1
MRLPARRVRLDRGHVHLQGRDHLDGLPERSPAGGPSRASAVWAAWLAQKFTLGERERGASNPEGQFAEHR